MHAVEPVALVVTVQCLCCGSAYSKPAHGGTFRANPGCPKCGYLGWSPEGEISDELEPPRFAADPLRVPAVRSH